MSPALLILLRLIHVVGGALWVGMAIYSTVFLLPSVEEAGPDGGKVMAALQRRGILTLLPALALATLISGFWLYWQASAGMAAGFGRSGTGIAFGVGGVAALVAYLLGIVLLRPSMMQAASLMAGAAGVSEDERRSRMAEAARLRTRAASVGRMVTVLLLLALAAMAVARYL